MVDWIGGVFFGLIIHEAAHIAVANHYGGKMTFNQNVEWIYQGPNENAVAIAGLAAQAITSELLLTRDYQTNFTKGWLAFNVGNTVNYTFRNETENGYGDLVVFTKDEARKIEAVLLVHSYTIAHRMKWKFFPTRNGIYFVKKL